MFWFFVSVVLLVVLLVDRNRSKEKERTDYQNGLAEGYQMAKNQIKNVRASKKNDTAVLDLFLSTEDESPESVVQTRPINVDSSTDVLFEDAPRTNELESTTQINQLADATPKLKPEELQRQQTARTIRNLNIILYVGSFLIVAATALFVTLTMPPLIKLGGLIAAIAMFYVGGLVLYDKSTRLRSAAIAFVGTGLAILPFIGFALTTLGSMSNEASWLVTSLIGLLAYTLATVRLQSQLVSYITMAFVISLALSAVSILNLAIIWYFIVVIGVSSLVNCLYVLSPQALPKIFIEPLRNTGLFITPIALIASLVVLDQMNLWMYTLLFAVSTVHYLVVWLIQRTAAYELVIRSLAHLTILILTADVVDQMGRNGVMWFGIIWVILASLQIAYSLNRLRLADNQLPTKTWEMICIGLAFSLLAGSLLIWPFTNHPSHFSSISLAIIGLLSGVVAYYLRQINWLYCALAVSVILPFVIGREVISPVVPVEILAGVFSAFGLMALVGLERVSLNDKSIDLRRLLSTSALIYASLIILCGALSMSSLVVGWTFALAAGIVIVLSYLLKQPELEIFGAVLGVISITAWMDKLLINTDWQLLVTVLISSVALAVGALAHQKFKQFVRRDYLAVLAAVTFGGLILGLAEDSRQVGGASTILLLVGSIGALLGRQLLRGNAKNLSTSALFAYAINPVLAMMIGLTLAGGWLVLATLISAGIVWASSYVERRPQLMLLGNGLLAIAVATLWFWLEFSNIWAVYGIAWISATIFYLLHWYNYGQSDSDRAKLSLMSVQVALVIPVIYGVAAVNDQTGLASAGSLLMLAGVVALSGYLQKQNRLVETAVYLSTFGLQWITGILLPEVNLVVYAHWWAVVIGLVAMWRGNYKLRAIIALSFVTISTGLFAVAGESGYSLLFLIEHLALLVIGALIRQQWAMWWGVIAVVLAVLYFLRGYTFLALLFLGFLLILFVIWRLIKISNKSSKSTE